MNVVYAFLALYVGVVLVVIPRTWRASDWAPPDNLSTCKRILFTALACLTWPYTAVLILWDEWR